MCVSFVYSLSYSVYPKAFVLGRFEISMDDILLCTAAQLLWSVVVRVNCTNYVPMPQDRPDNIPHLFNNTRLVYSSLSLSLPSPHLFPLPPMSPVPPPPLSLPSPPLSTLFLPPLPLPHSPHFSLPLLQHRGAGFER